MKHLLKINRLVQFVMLMILVLAFMFVSMAMVSPIKAQVDNQENATTAENTKIKATIQSYFMQRYEAQKAFLNSPTNSSAMYSSSVVENADAVWMQKEKDRLEILQTIATATHFNFTAYKFSLVYQGIKVAGNIATVTLLENNELSYPGSSEPTLLGNLPHTITLKKNAGGAWHIAKDDYLDDILKSMAGTTKADVLNTIHKNLSAVEQIPANADKSLKSPNLSDNLVPQQALTTYAYHPSYAVGYADANWNRAGVIPNYIQNDPGFVAGWKTTYKVEGITDCANFVSQAIFLGADGTASDANYFFPNSAHYNDWWYYKFSGSKDSAVGGSLPWVNVYGLYTFLTGNTTGRGPYGVARGTPAVNGCGLAPGDPILMQGSTGSWIDGHAVIMRAYAANCAYPPYAWVDAHTNNRRNVPLANYLSFRWFPVHIQGYRK